jgi:uncharacterized protein (TIGR02246 family)
MYRPLGNSVPNPTPFLDVESTIRGLTQDYNTAFNTANYDQVAVLFASDGILMPPHREAAHGPKAIERVLRDLGESGCQDLRLETVQVDYSSDIAIEIGRYTVAVRQENGTTVADRGKFVHAWRRLGAWLIVADSWSSDLPLLAR